MKNGLAIWHYPHRTVAENVKYFAENGFDAVSVHGDHMDEVCRMPEEAELVAELVKKYNLTLTVHHKLPATHNQEHVAAFQKSVDRFGVWQKKHGLLAVLSFDVPDAIRDNVTSYIEYALQNVPGSRIAVEDFGLTDLERGQIEHLKKEPRFGYLLDIGHMLIRLRGENTDNCSVFYNYPDECPKCDKPGHAEFLGAFRSKEFPVFEIHLHNNNGVSDLHRFLDDGILDVSAIASVLKELQWDGVLTIESAPGYTFPCYGAEADAGILATYEFWKKMRSV